MSFFFLCVFFFLFFFFSKLLTVPFLVAMLDLVGMVTQVRNILSYIMFVCLKKTTTKVLN